MTALEIRCSALPRIAECPASAIPPAVKVNWKSEIASLGDAGHESIAGLIREAPLLIANVAAKHGVDIDDARRVYGGLEYAWKIAKPWFPNPEVEVGMTWTDDSNGITLTGTTDLLSIVGNQASIGDWKTGWVDRDAEFQVKGYALLTCMTRGAESVKGYQFNSRIGNGYTWEWSRADLLHWWDTLTATHCGTPPVVAGTHCQFCPRWAECPAGRDYVRAASHALLEVESVEGLAPDRLIALAEARKLVQGACETVQDLLRNEVASRGGKVDHTDGKRSLQLSPYVKREIDFDKGMPVVVDALGERWKEAGKFSKTTCETIIKEAAPRGHKGTAVQAFIQKLDAAGALGAVPETRLEIKRNK